jgi:KDO2-lipid IV(A) lauroyltransferase
VERSKDKKGDIRKATQEVMDLLESHIRSHPEDWFWLHDRWKSVREIGLD